MRYVIDCGVALRLLAERPTLRADVRLVAPTLLRSQVLTALYREVRGGTTTKADAEARLDHLRSLRPRLLGDRVLQATAWRLADELGWSDTCDAEYLAAARLQADALVSLDPTFGAGVVPLASWDDLVRQTSSPSR